MILILSDTLLMKLAMAEILFKWVLDKKLSFLANFLCHALVCRESLQRGLKTLDLKRVKDS